MAAATEVFTALGEYIYLFDAQIAAICQTRGAALATRNGEDFEETGIDVVNLWQETA